MGCSLPTARWSSWSWPDSDSSPHTVLSRPLEIPRDFLLCLSPCDLSPPGPAGPLTTFRLVQRKAWHSRLSLCWLWAMYANTLSCILSAVQ